jgi:glyoxylase-like metal-dependent hydrolase (beta-lactamase superfamily II)
VLWEKEQPADERNRIRLALRCLLLVGNGRTILVDGGIGDKHASARDGSKFGEIYAVEDAPCAADAIRARAKLDPASVTDVIATHLHFDHAGGLTRFAAGSVDLSFPNANVFVQASHLAWAQSPPPKERASFLPENVDPIASSSRLRLLSGPETVAPGVSVSVKQGHTTGFQIVEVRGDGGEKLVFLSDLVPTASHLKLPFVMGYDNQPIVTLEEKRALFALAARNGDTLFFEHDPRVVACRLRAEGDRYAPVDVLTGD